MNLDTLLVDTDRPALILLWRGVAEMQSDDSEEISDILVVSEPLSQTPCAGDRYRPCCRERTWRAATFERRSSRKRAPREVDLWEPSSTTLTFPIPVWKPPISPMRTFWAPTFMRFAMKALSGAART